MKKSRSCVGIAAIVGFAMSVFAGDGSFRLGASDGYGESSYDTKGHWVRVADGAAATTAPTAGGSYLVADGLNLRTRDDGNTREYVFGGDVLTLGTDTTTGTLMLKTRYSAYPVIRDLVLVNGKIATAWNDTNAPGGFKGKATVKALAARPFVLDAQNGRTLRLYADVVGASGTAFELTCTEGAVGGLAVGGDNSQWLGQLIAQQAHSITFTKPTAAAVETTFGGNAGVDVPDAWVLGGGARLVLPDGFGSVKASRRGITVEETGAELNVASGAALYDGLLTGPGVLRRTGAGTLTLDGTWTGAKMACDAGVTVLGSAFAADADSSLAVAAGATLVVSAPSTLSAALTFADGAELRLDNAAEDAIQPPVLGRVTVDGCVRVSLAALPNDLGGADGVALLSFDAASGLTADSFVAGTVAGVPLPFADRFIVETNGSVATLKVVFHPYVRGLQPLSCTEEPSHWTSGEKAYDATKDYLVVGGSWRYALGSWEWNVDFTGGSYSIAGSASAPSAKQAERCFFMPKHVTNNIHRLAFYGSAGIVPGGTNRGFTQRLYGLDESAVIDIANVGEQAFFIDPNNTFFYVNVPLRGSGRLRICAGDDVLAGYAQVVCFRRDNSAWCGPTEIFGTKLGVTLYIQDENQLGAPPTAFDARFLTVGNRGTLALEENQIVRLDDANRGVTLEGGSGLETRKGATLTFATPVVFGGGTVSKRGVGRLAWAAASTGSGTLAVQEGELSVTHGRALGSVGVSFAKGTALVVSAAPQVEETLAEYGLLNLTEAGVTAADRLTVRVDVSMAKTAGVRRAVPILTVRRACADVLFDKLVPARIGRGISVTLARRDVVVDDVEATQIYAVCEWKGVAMVIR